MKCVFFSFHIFFRIFPLKVDFIWHESRSEHKITVNKFVYSLLNVYIIHTIHISIFIRIFSFVIYYFCFLYLTHIIIIYFFFVFRSPFHHHHSFENVVAVVVVWFVVLFCFLIKCKIYKHLLLLFKIWYEHHIVQIIYTMVKVNFISV